ncbi:RNA polymerase sigma factor [Chitinophaga ginsengisegetis]|uniref:RNA polymerase sigma factor n=1 Tax=Chitinophaga ginsengisegetis TaxID=393003 RepID=UPI000DBF49DF|nr:RNA polymerase sigma-70 factor [Chitinophaga ginsengisegetis]MDR6567401.1 RNA polymerase sigma-70 factor (ECF subfamily) [Chitinophaga ginsengisegetis]MDR6647132.1 RNA polymerase sigma-70 factor (ECF subfamily) [Chitinophaga ginsengisegetis]MDR6653481.1 RNA polymerase sigma-70 factor (ECF subfamily) [Chitinophaga ginsengisegetis]
MENTRESPDVQLILRLQAGDETAFREVFDRFSQKIYGLACHFLKNKDQGKEVVQETMLRLWEHRLKLSVDYALAPYVYTIARRVALNLLRQAASSRAASLKLWESIPAYHNDTEETVLGADLERITGQILSILPPQQQEIFRLSRFEGLTYEEIAVRMNISPHTVKYHMMAALKVLRTHFNEAEIVFGFLAFSLLF